MHSELAFVADRGKRDYVAGRPLTGHLKKEALGTSAEI
jgi:hypothetical protein